MRYTVKQKIIAVTLLGLIVLAAGGIASYRTVVSLLAAAELREPVYKTLAVLKDMRSQLMDIETTERGFAVTGKAAYMEQYAGASEMIRRDMDTVRALTAKNQLHQLRLDLLRPLIHQRLDFTDAVIDLRRSNGRKVAEQQMLKGEGILLGNKVRSILSDMEREEKLKLAQWERTMRIAGYNVWYALAAFAIGTLAIIIIALIIILREFVRFRRTEHMLQRLSFSLDNIKDLVAIITPKGKIEYINSAVENTTGYTRQELIGKGREVWGTGQYGRRFFKQAWENVRQGQLFQGEVVGEKKSGEIFYLNETAAPLKDRKGNVKRIICVAQDITHQRNIESRLDYLAAYDPLTDIPNRSLFIEKLQGEITKVKQGNGTLAVFITDLDRFKFINDVYGFEVGDIVLKRTAEKLSASLSKGYVAARLGSDEFGFITPFQQQADLVPLVQRIMDILTETVKANGEEVMPTVSMGIALYPQDGEDAHALIKNADIALSRAKAQGRNTHQFYAEDMNVNISKLVIMEKHLFSALKNQEYTMNYQPYCDISTKKVVGSEALIRWKNDKLGLISPSKFIPILEDTNKIIEVGEWTLKTVCRQIKEWGRSYVPVPIAVNLSMIQFRHAHIVDMVESVIKEFDLNPKYLTLEITESIFMQNMDLAISVLKKLKGIGVSLSVDDFGTGYSSLSYLKRLPVDNVKIDISFIREVTVDPDVTSLVTAIISMAHSLRLRAIAEGVETEEQWKVLRLLKCDIGQGYYFSHALSAQEFEKHLR